MSWQPPFKNSHRVDDIIVSLTIASSMKFGSCVLEIFHNNAASSKHDYYCSRMVGLCELLGAYL